VKNTSKIAQKKWATDEGTISLDELKRGIKKAEQGPFYSTEEAKKILKQWRARKGPGFG
jgi:predicted transcriptional regulator